ncbi:MAG TPA: MerR family transcriptional regulator [Actinocatenispora sp.]
MSTDARWTLDELVELVGSALSRGYHGSASGRVRDLPDRRAVRWYTTTGLVDRPSAMRGRTALYGTRQLRQLVAIKRRQAEGRTLAQIQAELAGATDATLTAVADLPDDLVSGPAEPPAPARTRFWVEAPAAPQGDGAVHGVRLPGGLLLLLPPGAGVPSADDLAAARAAAGPLLATLTARGLVPGAAHDHTDTDPPGGSR